ncbi:hypothetical protein [Cryptosporangium aurantiacum]|uniref:hypothetical protein n=1 Tax=Cryptosporangium aurantiacum TaxID=134849 RepID=UPI00093267DB|nr:hypothetical protein [Cryptosporangium aurantiacum]
MEWRDFDKGYWSGTLNSNGQEWQSSSELKLHDVVYAHLKFLQSGGVRYHTQKGQINLTQWHSFTGSYLGNYFWKPPPGDTVAKPLKLPEVDPLQYLGVEQATNIARTDLPGGGHRYMLRNGQWVPEEPLGPRRETGSLAGPLTVDVDGSGRPIKLDFQPMDSEWTTYRVIMTVRDFGRALTITPPPADEVVRGAP